MVHNLLFLAGAIVACDFIWRVVRIVNGVPIIRALREITRIEFIINLTYVSLASGYLAYAIDHMAARIIGGFVSAGSAAIVILEVIYGGEKPQVNHPADKQDAPCESN